MVASHNGHVEVVDKLLQHGTRVDLQSKVCLTFQNSLNIFIDIISHFSSHTCCKQSGVSSLMIGSHKEVIDKLLEHGARVDLQTKVHVHYNCRHLSEVLHNVLIFM